jgi:hypothetical protein
MVRQAAINAQNARNWNAVLGAFGIGSGTGGNPKTQVQIKTTGKTKP